MNRYVFETFGGHQIKEVCYYSVALEAQSQAAGRGSLHAHPTQNIRKRASLFM